MAFNLQEFRAAHRPWMFVAADGRAFPARHVSARQLFDYQDAAVAAGTDRRAAERALRHLLRLAFPWRLSYLAHGDPVRLILALEPAARMAALHDFFEAQRGGPTTTPRRPAMSGTRSSTPISTGTP